MVKKMQVVRDNNKRRGREKNKKIVSCKIVNKIKKHENKNKVPYHDSFNRGLH